MLEYANGELIVDWIDYPSYWRSKICTCAHSVYGYYGEYPVTLIDGRCSKCRKHRNHILHTCISCNEIFAKDFKHPGFDWKMPECWECLERNPDYVCQNYPEQVIEYNIQQGKVPSKIKKESEMLRLAEGPSVFSFLKGIK
jgi:hypothetical protein